MIVPFEGVIAHFFHCVELGVGGLASRSSAKQKAISKAAELRSRIQEQSSNQDLYPKILSSKGKEN
jgi:hypothetical protein